MAAYFILIDLSEQQMGYLSPIILPLMSEVFLIRTAGKDLFRSTRSRLFYCFCGWLPDIQLDW
jgi:hypothetical protein